MNHGRAPALEADNAGLPLRSKEGWVLFVTGLHEEATEEDLREMFSAHGQVICMEMNVDRRTGFMKGYALVEFANGEDAQRAQRDVNGSHMLGQELYVNFCFVKSAQKNVRQ